MFVETSALVAIVIAEEGSENLAERLARGASPVISAVTQVEAAIAVGRFHQGDYEFGSFQVRDFIERADIEVLNVPADLVGDVLETYGRYGKGTGHRAQLNFGDCFSYAFAKRLGRPLLFKGDDFAKTDIEVAA